MHQRNSNIANRCLTLVLCIQFKQSEAEICGSPANYSEGSGFYEEKRDLVYFFASSPIYQSPSFLLVQALVLAAGWRGMSRHAVWAGGILSWKEGEEDRRDGGWQSWEWACVMLGATGDAGTWRPPGFSWPTDTSPHLRTFARPVLEIQQLPSRHRK